MEMILNSHQFLIKMLIKAITAYMNILRKYMEFYNIYSRTFKDFLLALDALSNARLTHETIDLVTLEIYLITILS